MAEQYTGTVEAHGNRKGIHSLKMDDGNWYGCFRDDPGVEKGQVCKFQWNWDASGQYRNVVKGSVKVKPGSQPAPASAGRGGAGARDEYWEKKMELDIENQKRISFQAATNTALAMVTAGVQAELLKLPKKDGWDAFAEYVHEYSQVLYDRYQNFGSALVAEPQEGFESNEADDEQNEEENEEW